MDGAKMSRPVVGQQVQVLPFPEGKRALKRRSKTFK